MIVSSRDILELLQKNYGEFKDISMEELSKLTRSVLSHLIESGILTKENEYEAYRISNILNRYQCTECNQISYIGEKEDRKCFSCESENIRERNVR
jgi:predicted transcriptional regulator